MGLILFIPVAYIQETVFIVNPEGVCEIQVSEEIIWLVVTL